MVGRDVNGTNNCQKTSVLADSETESAKKTSRKPEKIITSPLDIDQHTEEVTLGLGQGHHLCAE
jgi:hypothetical protein